MSDGIELSVVRQRRVTALAVGFFASTQKRYDVLSNAQKQALKEALQTGSDSETVSALAIAAAETVEHVIQMAHE